MFGKAKPPVIVNIPNPCHENWQKMDLHERGRFCQSCQTAVVDYTVLSDAEIIKHIEQAAGNKMCGRLLISQTNRQLRPDKTVENTNPFKKALAAALMAYATINKVLAEDSSAAPDVQQVQVNVDTTSICNDSAAGILIKGRVLDYGNGQTVPHIELQVIGTDYITRSDKHGRFELRLPNSCVGYEVIVGLSDKEKIRFKNELAELPETKVLIDTIPFEKQITVYLRGITFTVPDSFIFEQIVCGGLGMIPAEVEPPDSWLTGIPFRNTKKNTVPAGYTVQQTGTALQKLKDFVKREKSKPVASSFAAVLGCPYNCGENGICRCRNLEMEGKEE